jgi:hypothetical protein
MLKHFSLSDEDLLQFRRRATKGARQIVAKPAVLVEPSPVGPKAQSIQRPAGDTSAKRWWSQTGSNRRPEACKATALPTELWPLTCRARHTSQRDQSHAASGDICDIACRLPRRSALALRLDLVGLERFELSTSRLSSARSNQLSYRPNGTRVQSAQGSSPAPSCLSRKPHISSEKKEKRSRRHPAYLDVSGKGVRPQPKHPMFLKRSD